MNLPARLVVLVATVLLTLTSARGMGQSGPGSREQEVNRLTALIGNASGERQGELIAELEGFFWKLKDEATSAPDPIDQDLLQGLLLAACELYYVDGAHLSSKWSTVAVLQDLLPLAGKVTNIGYRGYVLYVLAQALVAESRYREVRDLLAPAVADFDDTNYRTWLRLVLIDAQRNDGDLAGAGVSIDALTRLHRTAATPPTADQECQLEIERARYLIVLGLPDRAYRVKDEAKQYFEGKLDRSSRVNFLFLEMSLALAVDRFRTVADELVPQALQGDLLARESESTRAKFLIRQAMALTELARRSSNPDERGELARRSRRSLDSALALENVEPRERMLAQLDRARLELALGANEAAWQALAEAELTAAEIAGEPKKPLPPDLERSRATLRARAVLAGPRDAGHDEEARRVALEDLLAAHARRLERVRSLRPPPGGVGLLHFDQERTRLATLIELSLEMGLGAEVALQHLLDAQALGSLSRALEVSPVTVDDVRREMTAAGRGVLVYLPAVEGTYAFLLDADSLLVAELKDSPRQTIEPLRRELELALRSPRDERLARRLPELARELARRLVPPEFREELAGWSEVTVVGSELFGWLPFECLPLPGERPFGEELAVASLPSLPLGVLLARRARELGRLGPFDPPPPGTSDVLVLAAPSLSPLQEGRFGAISLTGEEREALTTTGGSGRQRLYVGDEATRDRLSADSLGDVRLLHLVTHGVQDFDRDRPTGLCLTPRDETDDGNLWCEEVDSMRVPEVVILSVCGAMLAPERHGDDGVVHLGGAFLRGGAHALVLSRVEVEQHATLALATALTRGLVQEGLSPAEALRRARCEVAAHHRWTHPYYHATMQAFGLAHEPLFTRPETSLDPVPRSSDAGGRKRWTPTLLAGVLGIVVFIAFLVCRRR